MEKQRNEQNNEKSKTDEKSVAWTSTDLNPNSLKENQSELSQNPNQQPNNPLKIPILNLSCLSPGTTQSSNPRKPSFPQFNQKQTSNGPIPTLNSKPAHLKALASDPIIPPLNLNLVSNTPNDTKPLNETPSRSISINALGDQIELDLSQISSESGKRERHEVLFCIPFSVFPTAPEFELFAKKVPSSFGEGSQITQVSNFPIKKWVIEGTPNIGAPTAIPSIQSIDAAYQNIGNIPFLIDQTTKECSLLTSHIEQTLARIEEMRNQREKLKIENALLRMKINLAKQSKISSR